MWVVESHCVSQAEADGMIWFGVNLPPTSPDVVLCLSVLQSEHFYVKNNFLVHEHADSDVLWR